jgi:nucleoside-diphosphate-sugar epimerase
MTKVLVTGGSGFIGTNLINEFLKLGWDVVNYDIAPPKIESHAQFWKNIDITKRKLLIDSIKSDVPDFIVHLAARTDLNEVDSIDGYKANIEGVRNIMDSASYLPSLKRIILASSMLVCRLGYHPVSFDDYKPNSFYGESKVETEKIIKQYDLNWTIVRPTSIWGPWFGEPYKNFFDLVIKGLYFNIPEKYASTKTYGYVKNACNQIISLMLSDPQLVNHNYFYLGDLHPINITNWANRIRILNSQRKLLFLPVIILRLSAIIGDILKNTLGVNNFPMTTFRFKNMTNDNIIRDIERTLKITKCGEEDNLDKQILETLNWLKNKK